MKPTIRRGPNIRGIHATFTGIYLILSGFWLAAPIIFIYYESIFLSGLLGWLLIVGAFMVSANLWGKEFCVCTGEYYLLNRFFISIIACCFFGFATTVYYIFDLVNILTMCPDLNANVTVSISSAIRIATVDQDQQFQLDRAAKICRNEYGFALFLVVLLILIEVLYLITIGVYAWLKSWTNCLCQPRPVHTPACILNVPQAPIYAPQQQLQGLQHRFGYNLK